MTRVVSRNIVTELPFNFLIYSHSVVSFLRYISHMGFILEHAVNKIPTQTTRRKEVTASPNSREIFLVEGFENPQQGNREEGTDSRSSSGNIQNEEPELVNRIIREKTHTTTQGSKLPWKRKSAKSRYA